MSMAHEAQEISVELDMLVIQKILLITNANWSFEYVYW